MGHYVFIGQNELANLANEIHDSFTIKCKVVRSRAHWTISAANWTFSAAN